MYAHRDAVLRAWPGGPSGVSDPGTLTSPDPVRRILTLTLIFITLIQQLV